MLMLPCKSCSGKNLEFIEYDHEYDYRLNITYNSLHVNCDNLMNKPGPQPGLKMQC